MIFRCLTSLKSCLKKLFNILATTSIMVLLFYLLSTINNRLCKVLSPLQSALLRHFYRILSPLIPNFIILSTRILSPFYKIWSIDFSLEIFYNFFNKTKSQKKEDNPWMNTSQKLTPFYLLQMKNCLTLFFNCCKKASALLWQIHFNNLPNTCELFGV